MTRFQLLLFFCVLSQINIAQNKKVETLKGRVVSNTQEVVGVYVLNRSKKKATITNPNGDFTIQVSLQDTLLFSAVQFKNRELIVTKKILDYNTFVINLDETLEELNEVILDNRTLLTAKKLGLPGADVEVLDVDERMYSTATNWFPSDTTFSLDPILNYFLGNTAKYKSRVQRNKRYKAGQFLYENYLDSTFVKELKIPQHRVHEFVLYCEQDEDFDAFSQQTNHTIIKAFFKMKSKTFLALKDEE